MSVLRLSKGDLCVIMGLYSRSSGRRYYHRLRTEVFTDEALSQLGIDQDDYARIRVFNPLQTKKIVELYGIEKEQMEDLGLPSGQSNMGKRETKVPSTNAGHGRTRSTNGGY